MSGLRRKTVKDKHGNKMILSINRKNEVSIDVVPNKLLPVDREHYMYLSDSNVRGIIRNWLIWALDNK